MASVSDSKKRLSAAEREQLLETLKSRFEKNPRRHPKLDWASLQARLMAAPPDKLWSLQRMEETGGEPDAISRDPKTGEYHFCDCAPETPAGRRSLCYDREALDERKTFKPENSAGDLAAEIGIELLTEEQYRELQEFGPFDTKTSSWLKTPPEIRKLGGGLFGDFRFGRVFIYHNGVQSYYAGRGFRGRLKI